ncbi:MAG: hypothetical protein HOE90_09450 [Bacteriovoracaceae bacterium]|nr:hypothetical protein [Bacteriovoracaceae bacterium]
MKHKFFKLLMIMAMAPSALASHRDSVISGFEGPADPPANVQGTICREYINDGDEHSATVCNSGVASADKLAQKYAKAAGGYLGCIIGYSDGIQNGYDRGDGISQGMLQQATAEYAHAEFTTAISRAGDKAIREGRTESASQIISGYRSVLGLNPSLQEKN